MLCSNNFTQKECTMTHRNRLSPWQNSVSLIEIKRIIHKDCYWFRPICALKSDYPPQDLLYLKAVILYRAITEAVYFLHSGSIKREEGRTVKQGELGVGLVSVGLQGFALEHKHPLYSCCTKQHPIKKRRNHNRPWMQVAVWLKYSEAWYDLQWATSQVQKKLLHAPSIPWDLTSSHFFLYVMD